MDLVKGFFLSFLKPEVVVEASSGKKLKAIELTSANLLPKEQIFIGSKARNLVNSTQAKDYTVRTFLDQVHNYLTSKDSFNTHFSFFLS